MQQTKRWLPLLAPTLPLILGLFRTPHPPPPLLQSTDRPGEVTPEANPAVIRQRRVAVDVSILRGPAGSKIRVPLFGGDEVELVRKSQEMPRPNTLIWYGQVDGEPGSMAILSSVGDALSADIVTRDPVGRFRTFEIRYLGARVHILTEIDPSRLPPEDPPNQPIPPPGGSTLSSCSEPASPIDALVAYTGRARVAAGNTSPGVTNSGIEAEIFEAMASTNLAYANSDIPQRLRLVHMQEVSYSEIDRTPTEILADLQNGVGGLSDLSTLRNTYSADVVVLIVASLSACGKANIMDDILPTFESQAFAVIRRNCSVANLSFGHELGHVMGAQHEWGFDPTPSVPVNVEYSHGYIQRTPTPSAPPWHTIMAVDKNCVQSMPVNCGQRLPYFSNPSIRYPDATGEATGVDGGADPADNHRRLNETALTVANFRCASPGPNNVWMKDTDDDTGREPDPQTASEDMWKSPAIWVRTVQDTSGMHAHDHQNPVAGAPNWIYVEVQNGGGTTFGELELYYANASTSLLWPAGWTRISSPRVEFATTSSQIVEVPWTPPQAGHFCLLARWVSSADPMTAAETENIESNVRNNNNIAWKNVSVIDLTAMESAKATFEVRPPADGSEFSLRIRGIPAPASGNGRPAFQLSFELDDAMLSAFREGGGHSLHVRVDGGRFIPDQQGDVVLSHLRLERGRVGQVKLVFERSGALPQRDVVVDVVQVRDGSGDPAQSSRPTGGVSYVVRTDRGRGLVR